MWIQWPFLQKNPLKQRSLTLRWPLTPHLLRSHVWLYPRIIVSKSHENTSRYVDTVNFFAKTWTKGHWPLDDLWPHICSGHMCDSTQGSLCPSPMKIHQSMWIQWTFLLKLEPKVIDPYMTFDPTSVEVTCVTLPKDHCVQVPWEYINVCGYSDQFCKNYHIHTHTYYIHTHTTYTYYVQNQWSHSLFLNYVQARQKWPKKGVFRAARSWGWGEDVNLIAGSKYPECYVVIW